MHRIAFQFKFTLVIIVLLSIVSTISYTIFSNYQRNSVIETVLQTVNINNQFLNSVIVELIVNENIQLLSSIIENLSKQNLNTNIQIFRLDGRAAFSAPISTDSTNNSDIEPSQSSFQPILFENSLEFNQAVKTGEPQVQQRENYINFFFPIQNTSDCINCQVTNEDLQGIIRYQISVQPITRNLQNYNAQYLVFLVISTSVIVLVLLAIFHWVISKPLSLLAESIGQFTKGELNVRVIEFKSKDIFESISTKLNVLFEDIQNKITIESDKRANEIAEKENQKYLQNVTEGILFIDSNRKITPGVSNSLIKLFETEEIIGKSFATFLFPNDEPDDLRMRVEIQEFLDVAFENMHASEELLTSLNPLQNKEINIMGRNGLKRVVINTTFHQILKSSSVISLMVSFSDVTKLTSTMEELASQKQIKESEFSLIASIIKADKNSYKRFIELAKSLKKELHTNKESVKIDKLEILRELSVNLGFSHLGDIIHSIIRELSSNSDSSQLPSYFEEFEEIINSIEQWKHEFASSTPNSAVSRKSNLHKLQSELEALISELCKEYGKSAQFLLRSKIQNLPPLPFIKDAIVHIIQNALIHGIESPTERLQIGKNKSGHIELFCVEMKGEYKIIIADDGNGIDFLDLEKRARMRRIINHKAKHSELIQLLFAPGLKKDESPYESSSLFDVQQIILTLNGKISIYTEAQKGTHITIIVPKSEST